jgi:hypothetical protein
MTIEEHLEKLRIENDALRALVDSLKHEIAVKKRALQEIMDIHTTPMVVRSTGMNGTTEERRQKRDTIEDLGPARTY